jgi:hypothetical protein
MANLTELNDSPDWLQNLTKEIQYDMYLRIKSTMPILRTWYDNNTISKLEEALAGYEKRNNIV